MKKKLYVLLLIISSTEACEYNKIVSLLDIQKVEEIVKESGKILSSFSGKRIESTLKDEAESLVTEADVTTEKFLIKELAKVLPGAAFFAEESGQHGDSDYCWVLDPLDGTTNFARDMKYFSISVALTFKGQPVLAYIYDPLRDELFFAERGSGSYLNGKPIRVAQSSKAKVLAVEFPYGTEFVEKTTTAMCDLKNNKITIRMPGSAVLDQAYVACGRFDGVFFGRLSWWDVAAGSLLITEAGGKVTDIHCKNIDAGFENFVAGSDEMHKKIISAIRK